MSENVEISKSNWLILIQKTLPLIDSQKFRLSAKETKNHLDTNPDRFFDLIRNEIGDQKWPYAFNEEEENAMARALSGADKYGEAVYKMGLENGLTPIIGCAALFMMFGT